MTAALRRGIIANAGDDGVLASDTFTRPDGPLGTAEVGGAWSTLNGTWTVTSGQAHGPSGNGDYSLATLDVGTSAVDLRVTFDPTNTVTNDAGPVARVVDINNYILFDFTFQSGHWLCRVFQRVAGAFLGLTALVDPITQLGADVQSPFRARLVVGGSYGADGGEAFLATPAAMTTWISMGSWSGADSGLQAGTAHGVAGKDTAATGFDDLTIVAAA